MKNIDFTIFIYASASKVWEALWQDANYREWTSVFSEGSYAVTDQWKTNTIVEFLNHSHEGMYALIRVHEPHVQMTFKYLGEIKNGTRIPFPINPAQEYEGTESYLLLPDDTGTQLQVEIVGPEEYIEFFKTIFPQGLQKVKEIAEKMNPV